MSPQEMRVSGIRRPRGGSGPAPHSCCCSEREPSASAAGRWVTPVTVVVCGRKQTVWWGSGVQVEASATGRRGSRAAGQAGRRADTRAVAPAGSVRALPPRRVTARGLLAVSAPGMMASPAASMGRGRLLLQPSPRVRRRQAPPKTQLSALAQRLRSSRSWTGATKLHS